MDAIQRVWETCLLAENGKGTKDFETANIVFVTQ